MKYNGDDCWIYLEQLFSCLADRSLAVWPTCYFILIYDDYSICYNINVFNSLFFFSILTFFMLSIIYRSLNHLSAKKHFFLYLNDFILLPVVQNKLLIRHFLRRDIYFNNKIVSIKKKNFIFEKIPKK